MNGNTITSKRRMCYALLTTILGKRQPSMVRRIQDAVDGRITSSELDAICQTLTNELCDSGLDGDEPNGYGLRIEELIDAIRGAYRMKALGK